MHIGSDTQDRCVATSATDSECPTPLVSASKRLLVLLVSIASPTRHDLICGTLRHIYANSTFVTNTSHAGLPLRVHGYKDSLIPQLGTHSPSVELPTRPDWQSQHLILLRRVSPSHNTTTSIFCPTTLDFPSSIVPAKRKNNYSLGIALHPLGGQSPSRVLESALCLCSH